jgi:ABC-type Zn uptake system ZnuABC Zn-binding protein ZnuA
MDVADKNVAKVIQKQLRLIGIFIENLTGSLVKESFKRLKDYGRQNGQAYIEELKRRAD